MKKIKTYSNAGLSVSDLALVKEKVSTAMAEYPVRLVYLFGSYGRSLKGGRVTKFSDFDLAVLLADEIDADTVVDTKLDLIDLFIRVFSRDDIDLTLINRADYILRREILTSGCLLFARSPKERIDFEITTRRDYFDMKFMRDFYRKNFIEKVKRSGGDGQP
ncbi:MAG: nucleotidyltransferase domain-containing protein [Clostridia bacterium]|nr:nucleotidyltransferase domain-containing protein [Clostridia bacterium]